MSSRRFMPPDSVMILLSFLSHSESALSTDSMCAAIGWFAEQAAAERCRIPHGLESVGGQFLRDQADQSAGCAIVADDVVAVDEHPSG